ncbi:hypothetical protein [Neorhizobium sp. NCHU2750]
MAIFLTSWDCSTLDDMDLYRFRQLGITLSCDDTLAGHHEA